MSCDGPESGDGIPDGWEEEYGTDAYRPDAGEDPDGDGWTNREEYELGTDPRSADDPSAAFEPGLSPRERAA